MTHTPPSLDDRLAALRATFASKLDERIGTLASLVDSATAAGSDESRRQVLADLKMAAHRMNGSAGTFGFNGLATAAHGLEQASTFLLQQATPVTASDCEDLPLFIAALKDAHKKEAMTSATPQTALESPAVPTIRHIPETGTKTVYIVEDEEEQARHMAAVLTNHEFDPVWLNNPEDLEKRLDENPPAAIIMDILFPESDRSGTEVIRTLRKRGLVTVPVIFVSSLDDFDARLSAMRAGGDGYLVKPIDAPHIANMLSHLTAVERRTPFRALIVDDDDDLVSYYSTILESADIDVKGLGAPDRILEVLTTFRPDVVVTDINMPGCNGFELAGIIHQHPDFVHTPIIFITAEDHSLSKVMALRFGGNDFLQKPVAPDLLLSSVVARSERSRLLLSISSLEKVRESEERFRQLADNIQEIFWMSDMDRKKVFYISPAYDRILKRSSRELYDNPTAFVAFLHPDDRDAFLESRRRHRGQALKQEFRMVDAEGGVHWVCEKSFPVRSADGTASRIVGITEDITEAKEAAAARAASEASFHTVFEASPALIALTDPKTGAHFDVNDAWLNTLEYTRKDVIGKTADEIGLWTKDKYRKRILVAMNEQGFVRNQVAQLRSKQGTVISVLVSAQRIHFAGEERYLWVAQDISERKQEEETLERRVAEATRQVEENALYMHSIVDNTAEGIITIDTDGFIRTFNHAAETIFGYTAAEVVDKDVSLLLPPGERADHRSYVSGSALYESRIINKARDLVGMRKDGTLFPLELNVAPMEVGGKKMFVGILHDITERKAAEQARVDAQRQAEEANRAKSEFLSSMSHELRTPLNAILGFSQLLQTDPSAPLTDTQSESVGHILRSGEHLLELINEILELARIETGQLSIAVTDVEAGALIQECLSLVEPRALLNGVLLINKTEGTSLPILQTDPTRLRQVLLNLLSNAVKYNKPDGTVTVETESRPNQKLRIRIHDTGYGISEEQQRHIFEPFNRLGRENDLIEGTGIGLAITQKLILALGGGIGFNSSEGTGSVFWVDVPVSQTQGASSDAETPDADTMEAHLESSGPRGPTHTVLYIEDNPANRHLMSQLFKRENDLTLVTAETAEKGIEKARAIQPDLILMDINLPGMSGYDALTMLQVDPALQAIPVVALSANARPEDRKKGHRAGFVDYLTKPIDVKTTITAIRDALTPVGN